MKAAEFKKLGDFVKIKTGKLDANASSDDGEYPFFTCSIEPLKISSFSYDCECCLVAGNGDLNVKYYNGKFDAYQRTYIIESLDKEKLDVMYLYFFLCSYIEVLRKQSIGGVIKYIKLGNLTDALIPIPSLKKQKEICRNLIQARKVLNESQALLSKYDILIKSRFIEMFGDPVQNPMRWEQRQLQDVCNAIVDCPHSTPNYTKENTGFMCIRTNIIRPTGLNWDDIEYISENEFYKRVSRRQPRIGDIVYLREGGILGIAAIINRNVNVALGQRTMLLSPNYEICNSIYVCETMNMKSFFNKALEKMGGSASPHINVADIKAFPISIPPIELQNDFKTFVQQIDKSKFAVQKSLEKAEMLHKSLMQEYFG